MTTSLDPGLLLSFAFEEKNSRDDNEPLSSSLSFAFEKKNQKMMTSRELLDLLSSSTFDEKNQKMTTSWLARRRLLHLRKKTKR